MTKAFLTMIGCCFCFLRHSVLQAQNSVANTDPMTAKLDEYITSRANAYKFNGSVLIAENGKILLQKGYGWQNFANHTSNNTATVFPICSLTKPFTAMVILKLQEEGKVS